MRRQFIIFSTLAILIIDSISIALIKVNAQETNQVVVEIEKTDVYDEVFGIDYGTDFVPGYYEPIVDEDIPLTPTQQFEISALCEQYEVDYYLLLALMYQESRFDADAVSKNKKCKGILQLNTKFHDVDDYFDVVQNAEGGCKYLNKLLEKNELPLALMIWHGESDARSKYKNGKISKYARNVMERRDLYAETVKYPGDGRTEEQN